MSVNTRTEYIKLGTTISGSTVGGATFSLKAPTELTPSSEYMVNANRNSATGQMFLQQIGRTQYTCEMKFAKLTPEQWWGLNRFLDNCGYVFYAEYFNHNFGRTEITRFYRGSFITPTLSKTTKVINGVTVPEFYYNAGVKLIDMGETVTTVKNLI